MFIKKKKVFNKKNEKVEKEKKYDEKRKDIEKIDKFFGFERYEEEKEKIGFLLNIRTTSIIEEEEEEYSAIDLYFIGKDNEKFKVTYKYEPYFYIRVQKGREEQVETWLRKRYNEYISNITIEKLKDLSLPNHLSGILGIYLKITFQNINQLLSLRKDLLEIVEENKKKEIQQEEEDQEIDSKDCILEIREYDVKYHIRTCIDKGIRSGKWYKIIIEDTNIFLKEESILKLPLIKTCTFDIETTKAPLMFPDSKIDSIMMISYMIDQQGYLITNREIISQDIEDFSYQPKEEFKCDEFIVFNEKDEKSLLLKFFNHLKEEKPLIYVTYNGDYFDWPFIEKRSEFHGIQLKDEIGYSVDSEGVYKSSYGLHMDCFMWVKRDSYLPQGSQGLKAVTKHQLGYDPIEVNPEEMVNMAMNDPVQLAGYSVSDSFATYFLYKKFIHPFIFSLTTIIPMPPDDVLRKGTGTLCETLLMVEAFNNQIICPNRHENEKEKFYKGHLIESETYVGGHVECLKSGIYRNDLKYEFKLDSETYQELINDVDEILKYYLKTEKIEMNDLLNYQEIKNEIIKLLKDLRYNSIRLDYPKIYHLDVGAMYPNIILTNRLQPVSIVSTDICSSCDFNDEKNQCQKKMNWQHVLKYYSASHSEYMNIKEEIEEEEEIKKRLKEIKGYSKKYQKETILKEEIVCMRENSFYVDTVKLFRDRRYEYKEKLKELKKNNSDEDLIIIYNSLQMAHKCILNSFYGYVMRTGARWRSMSMAGIVTYQGSQIIKMAHSLIDKIGMTLELDTDGIWCILPFKFPENFKFQLHSGKTIGFSFPMIMLNKNVATKFTNHQYQTLKENGEYKIESECSIFFEVDGPYKAMILPASQKEGKNIKKRYAVFNENGSLAELKGFEIKRRGELKIIKNFQEKIFSKFLLGNTLEECYSIVGKEADTWLDILYYQGKQFQENDKTLFSYLTESSNMSKNLSEYGEQKSSRITTAKRLCELLGSNIQEKGLNCKYIVSKYPDGSSVSERVIPIEVFHKEPDICISFLKKWTKNQNISDTDVRKIIDWKYYIERLSNTIQKLITIPASFQNIKNPIERVKHPDWIIKKSNEKKQKLLTDMYDIENLKGIQMNKEKIIKKDEMIKIDEKLDSIYHNPDQPLNDQFFENDSYSIWLKNQKEKWKSRSYSIQGHFTRNVALKKLNWNIIEIKSTNEIGLFKLFILIQNEIEIVYVEMKKKIYINYYKENLNNNNYYLLPRNKKSYDIIEKELKEEIKMNMNSEIEGIYEKDVPNLFRFLFEIGNICKCNKVEDIISIDSLTRVTSIQESIQIPFIYIYHTFNKDYGIFGIMKEKLKIYLYNSGKVNKENLDIIYCKNKKEAIQKIMKELNKNEMILLNSEIEIEEWKDIYMIFKIPFHSDDTKFPLDWMNHFIKKIPIRYEQGIEYYKEMKEISRECSIPICNIENMNQIMNILFSRELKKNHHLLWIGQEQEYIEDIIIERKNSKLYDKVIEIDMKHLDIHSILESESNSNEYSIENLLLNKTFKILKKMIENIYYEYGTKNGTYENVILNNFYKYIHDSNQLLYDPYLTLLIKKLIKKNWTLLLNEFKKYGNEIVYSNIHKIIIHTNKENIDYLLNNLMKNKLFSWIELEPIQIWNYLLFIDQDNYIGITNQNELKYHFNFKLNLEKDFIYFISKYIQKSYQETNLIEFIDDYYIFILLSFIESVPNRIDQIEFINILTFVLSFDKRILIDKIKNTLLKSIGIEPFSKESIFQYHTFYYQHICNYCYSVKNLNLFLLKDFKCSECNHDINKLQLEYHLIQDLQNLIISYQSQDLICKKCEKVNQDYLSNSCECNGEYSLSKVNSIQSFYDLTLLFQDFTILKDMLNKL